MGHGWIIDVIADLRRYADQNGLHNLAAQLSDATDVAAIEVALIESRSSDTSTVGTGRDGDRPRAILRAGRIC